MAVAFPSPDAAPVTNAMRPASGFGFGARFNFASSRSQYSIRNFSDSSIGEYLDNASDPRITLIAFI